jgi:hypothetical protein
MQFETQTAANSFVQLLLNSQPLRAAIPEPHHTFLCSLLALHPRGPEKIGSGISYFTVEHAVHGTRCFYLTRTDGSRTDFSYFKCVRGNE